MKNNKFIATFIKDSKADGQSLLKLLELMLYRETVINQ